MYSIILRCYNIKMAFSKKLANTSSLNGGFNDAYNFKVVDGIICHNRSYKADKMTWADVLINGLPLEVTISCENMMMPEMEKVVCQNNDASVRKPHYKPQHIDHYVPDDFDLKVRNKRSAKIKKMSRKSNKKSHKKKFGINAMVKFKLVFYNNIWNGHFTSRELSKHKKARPMRSSL